MSIVYLMNNMSIYNVYYLLLQVCGLFALLSVCLSPESIRYLQVLYSPHVPILQLVVISLDSCTFTMTLVNIIVLSIDSTAIPRTAQAISHLNLGCV